LNNIELIDLRAGTKYVKIYKVLNNALPLLLERVGVRRIKSTILIPFTLIYQQLLLRCPNYLHPYGKGSQKH
jgi:hypothetical protein